MTDKLKEAIEVLKKNRERDTMLKRKYHPNAGEKYYNERSDTEEAIDTVVSAVENPTYTPADMDSFAEWCSLQHWTCYDSKMWLRMYRGERMSGDAKTTAQLREIWEKESKVCGYCKGEGWIEEPLRTIPCPACGGTKIGEATE